MQNQLVLGHWNGDPSTKTELEIYDQIKARSRTLKCHGRVRINNKKVVSRADLDAFLAPLMMPKTAAEVEALPPTQAYVIWYEWDDVYGPAIAMSCNAVSENLLHEVHSHSNKENLRILTCKAESNFDLPAIRRRQTTKAPSPGQ